MKVLIKSAVGIYNHHYPHTLLAFLQDNLGAGNSIYLQENPEFCVEAG